ncbi:sulfatase-like hydrolase/transferase [Candidatus Poribacteria bacterium]|nr:sulfatase-like hydrolase/transferase [Candidatus Poribacteria bacterium]
MKQDKKPNFLIIMSDDQGAWAMGCAGNSEIQTPNLDKIAGEGIRFHNFFCTSPVCSPARASFLTGRIPSQHGVHDWIKSGNIDVEDGVTWCGADHHIEYLQGMTGFTDILADNGYTCGLSGKWHVGHSAKPQKSHSYWYAHSLGGDSYVNYFVFENSPELVNKTQYVTDYFTDKAIDFLDDNASNEKPFCLSLHYTAPHAPWGRDNHPHVFDLYADCPFDSIPVEPPHPWRGWNPSPEKRREALQGYFSAVTAMDTNIGRVIQKLEDMGIRDNTIIVFLADNGMNMGHHGICGKGNGTFPMNMYDTSVKVPLLISCPGRIPQDIVNCGLYSQYDFMPTVLDYLGFENPEGEKLPGRSFADVLKGKEDKGNENVVVFDEYGPVRMIRNHEWKYIHRYPYGPHELYNLENDPDEINNLVEDKAYDEIIVKMRGQIDEWFCQYSEPMLDGSRLAVTGKGQIDLAGPKNKGRKAFV